MNEPDRLAATGRQVQSNVKRLKNPTGPYIQKLGKPASSSQTAAVGGATSSTAAVPTAKKVRHIIIKTIQMVETRLLNPAEKIIYTLIFKPNNPFISINGAFTVLSQQLEYDDFPSYNEIKPQSLTGELEIRRVAAGFIVLFVIACFILLVFAVGASLLAAGWLKGFLPLI